MFRLFGQIEVSFSGKIIENIEVRPSPSSLTSSNPNFANPNPENNWNKSCCFGDIDKSPLAFGKPSFLNSRSPSSSGIFPVDRSGENFR